jgi:predicted nucleic acid-binding protein
VNVYAESSAVLAWILGQPGQDAVEQILRNADLVVASDLTLLECFRVFHRSKAAGLIDDAESASLFATLKRLSGSWVLVRIDDDVLERAGRPFPSEPIRTLDAIHLATAVSISKSIGHLSLLTLDQRIIENAKDLGFEVSPGSAAR